MVHPGEEPSLIVFVGPTGDHNDRGMEGASIVGRELSRRRDLTPTFIGKPQPATSETWQTALPAALPMSTPIHCVRRAKAWQHGNTPQRGNTPQTPRKSTMSGTSTGNRC